MESGKYFEKTYLEPRYLSLSAMLVALTCLTAVMLPTGSSPYGLPIPGVIMVTAIFLSPRIAFLLSTLLLTILTVGMQYNAQFMIIFVILSKLSILFFNI